MNKKIYSGFTLIELIITVAIAGIVLSFATPSLRGFLLDNRLSSQVNEVVSALSLARSEAVKRDTRVTVCKSADGLNCTTVGGWEQGWIVFVDNVVNNNINAAVENPQDILRTFNQLDGNNTLRGNRLLVDYVSYVNTGLGQGIGGAPQNGTFVLCDERGFSQDSMAVIVSRTGRVRSAKASTTSATSCL